MNLSNRWRRYGAARRVRLIVAVLFAVVTVSVLAGTGIVSLIRGYPQILASMVFAAAFVCFLVEVINVD